jgi:heme a synthase
MRSVKVLSTVAAIGSFAVIVLGKIVNVTGASTSIPDWPLAFGQLVPKMTPLVFWEWTHRLAVLIVFVTTLALVVCAARVSGKLALYSAMSLVMLLVPAVIGGISILYPPLHWTWAVVDFAFAILYFASVISLAVWAHMVEQNRSRG